MIFAGVAKRPTANDSRSLPIGVQGFKSLPPHTEPLFLFGMLTTARANVVQSLDFMVLGKIAMSVLCAEIEVHISVWAKRKTCPKLHTSFGKNLFWNKIR